MAKSQVKQNGRNYKLQSKVKLGQSNKSIQEHLFVLGSRREVYEQRKKKFHIAITNFDCRHWLTACLIYAFIKITQDHDIINNAYESQFN